MTRAPWELALRDGMVNDIRTHLSVRQDQDGVLHFAGHDLGLPVGLMSDDDEYEYSRTVQTDDIGQLIEMLDGRPGGDLRELLSAHWSDDKSFELERRLGQARFEVEFFSC